MLRFDWRPSKKRYARNMGVRLDTAVCRPVDVGGGADEGRKKGGGGNESCRVSFSFPFTTHHHCRALARQCPERATRAGVASGSVGESRDRWFVAEGKREGGAADFFLPRPHHHRIWICATL